MSKRAIKHLKDERRLCERCRDRKARLQYRGAVRADRADTLCFECFRAQREHTRAVALGAAPAEPLVSPFGAPRPLPTARQSAHRRAMLHHLERCAGR